MGPDIVSGKKLPRVSIVLGAAVLSACTTSSHVLVAPTRTPLSSNEVRVYLEPISGEYEKIAVVEASSRGSFSWTAQAQADVVMERLEAEAAKLGANGILLEEIDYGAAGQAGTDVSPDLTRDHASIGLGFAASGLLGTRHGRAVAIYTAPAGTDPATH